MGFFFNKRVSGVAVNEPVTEPLPTFNLAGGVEPQLILDIAGGHRTQLTDVLINCGAQASDAGDESAALVIGGGSAKNGSFQFSALSQQGHFHPAVLADLLHYDLSRCFIVGGYPGSGNALLQGMCTHLIGKLPPPNSHQQQTTYVLAAFTANYRTQLDVFLTQIGKQLGTESQALSVDQNGALVIVWRNQQEQISLFGLPNFGYLYENLHRTHEKYGLRLRRLQQNGAKIIISQRDPLDIIVSMAHKLALVGIDLLGDEWMLGEVAEGVVAYYHSFLPEVTAGHAIFVDYRDCQSNFEGTMLSLADRFSLAYTHEDAVAARQLLLNRPLSSEGHLWRPGVGKWQEFISARHADLLRERGVFELAQILGYSYESLQFTSQPEQMVIEDMNAQTSQKYGTPADGVNLLSYCMENLSPLISRLGLTSRHFPIGSHTYTAIGQSAEIEKRLRKTGGFRELEELLDAARPNHSFKSL